jgi:DNA-binding transcriptional regulator YdaS (Cro superfamily)
MTSQAVTQSKLIERAILSMPGRRQGDLAAAMGVAQQTVSKLLRGEIPVSPEHAMAIHRATRGAVPGSALRPDLWCCPAHVPVDGMGEGAAALRRSPSVPARRSYGHA